MAASISVEGTDTRRPSGTEESSWSPAERLDHAVISRDVVLANAGLAEVAADQQVHLIHPLLDQAFVASLRSALSERATMSRSEILSGISGGAFPDSSTAARPKAHFHEVFFREPTREFARTWDGQGADATRVDRDALRRLWAQWPIPLGTAGWSSSCGCGRPTAFRPTERGTLLVAWSGRQDAAAS